MTLSPPVATPDDPIPRSHGKPMTSLVASAQRLTSRTMKRTGAQAKGWQEDAWEMYDLVGEERFLATTLAGRVAQARLFVGKVPDDATELPEPVEDPAVAAILDAIGDSNASRAQLVMRLAINLFVAGDGWLAGIPRHLFPESLRPPMSLIDADTGMLSTPYLVEEVNEPGTLSIEDLEWKMLSVSEIASTASGEVTIRLGQGSGEVITCSPDEVFLVRVWRPHPRRWWEADSPTRSSLPVLRELVGLTMHISAQVDSRLAGAGLLIVPASAQSAIKRAAALDSDEDEGVDDDPFTEALMEAMIKPIGDRASASALVPLVVTVPDDATGLFQYLTFAKPLDAEARSLRDEAIRRLALGQDAPPELLLGTGGMNHWGAWLVQEEVVTTHIEPPLALIADALTTQYLWPVLMDQGMSEDEAHGYVIWYDVSDMIVRPNRATDAKELHKEGVINDKALRDATGFEDGDASYTDIDLPPSRAMALDMVRADPTLLNNPGVTALVEGIEAILTGNLPQPEPMPPALAEANQAPPTDEEPPAEPGAPPTADTPPPPVESAPPPPPPLTMIRLPGSMLRTPGFDIEDGF